ncbi:quinolinate synthase NadA [Flavobacterium oreochromis]|uniref:quinolinate synthase NadA n=1 Tax=Flavobacterium oreochromis TaxID=2906078 RepID=UPI00385C6EF8
MNNLEIAKKDIIKNGFLKIENKNVNYIDEINRLRKEKNAVILAHYYQRPEIQDIADFVGDSLALAQKAAETTADLIVFAGVHFMAETAKILNPTKKVVLPDLKAGCSLADSCPASDFQTFINKHPNHTVVSYVNTSAEIKALTDIVCTSSNAEKIINSIPLEKPIIFAPDKNLGSYLIQKTGRDMLLWNGACLVHEAFSIDKIIDLYQKNPDAEIIAHPESQAHILKIAKYIGSTAGLLNYVKTTDAKKFIVATEVGILHKMQQEIPDKIFIAAPANDDNCNCSECAFMKLNTLEKLYLCMKYELPNIEINESLRKKAVKSINAMLEISK